MGHYEDLYYEIYDSVTELGIKKEFDAQLAKMQTQDKHRYKETKQRWDYAYQKVKRIHEDKQKKK